MSQTRMIVLKGIVSVAMVIGLAIPAWASVDDLGCTPGFWKQDQHFGHWVTYTPDDVFDVVFGVGSPEFLYDALRAKGGGERALMRHAVAAILNAENPTVNFLLTPQEVISIVQLAYGTEDFESAKNLLELANDEGCPL